MSAARQDPLPNGLESPRAKLVYLYLAETDQATVGELQRALGLPKLTLFHILTTLTSKELVRQTETGYVCL